MKCAPIRTLAVVLEFYLEIVLLHNEDIILFVNKVNVALLHNHAHIFLKKYNTFH